MNQTAVGQFLELGNGGLSKIQEAAQRGTLCSVAEASFMIVSVLPPHAIRPMKSCNRSLALDRLRP
jgi:hypothetical protein